MKFSSAGKWWSLPIVLSPASNMESNVASNMDLQRPKLLVQSHPPPPPHAWIWSTNTTCPRLVVILLLKLKCGLLLTISLATVSFNTINVPTSLCNNGILFFACHSIIIMSAYCTFPSSKVSFLYQNVRLTMSELCNKTTLVQQKTTKCS